MYVDASLVDLSLFLPVWVGSWRVQACGRSGASHLHSLQSLQNEG